MADKHHDQTSRSQSIEATLTASEATVSHILERKGHDVFTIRPQQTLREAVTILRDNRIGVLVVTDANGDMVGILSERDIVSALADTPGQTLPKQVQDVMTTKVETCTPDESLVRILRRMNDGRFRHMPVVKNGDLTGLISVGDVVDFRLIALEYEALKLKQLIVG